MSVQLPVQVIYYDPVSRRIVESPEQAYERKCVEWAVRQMLDHEPVKHFEVSWISAPADRIG